MLIDETTDSDGDAKGALIVVGLGIRMGQITHESKLAVQQADVVFALVSNEASMYEIEQMNSNIISLQSCYGLGKDRRDTYHEMVEMVLSEVRKGSKVCFVTYGHPGVFALPTHESVKKARAEGFHARMLPGVSAEDSLFADLGIDPGLHGCQSFDASDFLLRERVWDLETTLVLWQVPVLGESSLPQKGEMQERLDYLKAHLLRAYGPDQRAILYEAAVFPLVKPRIEEIKVADMVEEMFKPHTTVVILPAAESRRWNEAFARLLH